MTSSYDFRLVGLAFIIAVIASYTALNLAGQVKSASGQTRFKWLIGGAVAMGTGIWSMHFVAMLAFNLPQPVAYDVRMTLLSLLDAILYSGLALLLVSRPTLSPMRLLSGGVFMGLAIASMHYIGMAAMQVHQGHIQYNLLMVGLSVVIAIAASLAALWLAFRLRDETAVTLNWRKLGSALIMGIAISSMHYTGMAAAWFIEGEGWGKSVFYALNTSLLGSAIAIATLIILGLALLTSVFEQRLAAQLAREEALQQSEKRFRMLLWNMPVGVLLLKPSLEIIFSNHMAIERLGLTDSHISGEQAFPGDVLLLQEDGTPFPEGRLPMQQAIATKAPVHNVVIRICCPNSQQPEPRWLLVNTDPQLTAAGRVERLVCTFSDITAGKQAESALRHSEAREREKAAQLELTLQTLRQTQAKLIQTEKMSSLGQLVSGVAHEINNPVSFIGGNLCYANEYIKDLLNLVHLYQKHYPNPICEIQAFANTIDLEFLSADLPKLLKSMKIGAERISQIVLSLRNFSHHNEAEMKPIDIHEGMDSTLLILQSRLKATGRYTPIEVVKEYGNLPRVECYAGQLNQVLMNILSNAIDALEEVRIDASASGQENTRHTPCIRIRTSHLRCQDQQRQASINGQLMADSVLIQIADNGSGMTQDVKAKLFDPFFTTKPAGKGTGLGLAISYQIVVEKHEGELGCESQPGQGTEFWIKIPVRLPMPNSQRYQELKHEHPFRLALSD
ncbi:ATP-binding protein [Microcoleus sp. ZQ-A2]|nr:PAS domain-containing protein [Microcoleus sp. FACHB-1]